MKFGEQLVALFTELWRQFPHLRSVVATRLQIGPNHSKETEVALAD
jgi:hypothetical protein